MLGMVLYACNGSATNRRQEWQLNGITCKPGYIYIQHAAVINRCPGNTMHQKLYYHLFGREFDDDNVVSAGFAFQGGGLKFNSWTNNANNTDYHDGLKEMSDDEITCLEHAWGNWKRGFQNTDLCR